MKRLIAILLAVGLLFCLAACENDTNDKDTGKKETSASESTGSEPTGSEPTGSEPSTPSEPEKPEEPEEPEEPVYEANLPADAILRVNGTEISVLNKNAAQIAEELGCHFDLKTDFLLENHPNGIPYTYSYKGEDEEGWPIVKLNEKYAADRETVLLDNINLIFDQYECPDLSLMGVDVNSSKEDVFSIFGKPDKTFSVTSGSTGYKWENLTIGEYTIASVSVQFSYFDLTEMTLTYANAD
jgi:hypothetical protein